MNYFRGKVDNIDAVGGIDNTGIMRLHVLGGYSFLKKNAKISIKSMLGIGYARYRHKQSSTKFNDDGFSIAGSLICSYRLGNAVGLFVKLDNQWDFLSIKTAPELERFFRRIQYFMPSVGIKIYAF